MVLRVRNCAKAACAEEADELSTSKGLLSEVTLRVGEEDCFPRRSRMFGRCREPAAPTPTQGYIRAVSVGTEG
jgi:hypothetical protein